MRRITFALAASAALIGLAMPSSLQAEAVKVTPELTVFSDKQAPSAQTPSTNDGRPTVLRGSATKRGTVDGRFGAPLEPVEYQIQAGDKLWLTDPETGRVTVCDERRTNRVGSRFIGCVEDRFRF